MEALASLLIKIHDGEISLEDAATYAAENIEPLETRHSEDGVYVEGDYDNAPMLLTSGACLGDYYLDELNDFIELYYEKREGKDA